MDNILEQIIGSGADWPITLQSTTEGKGWYPIKGDYNLIRQNLSTIIDTQIGFMMRNEEFGSRILEVIEEPNSQISAFLIKKYMRDAIQKYEPRVLVTEATGYIDRDSLILEIRYQIIGTNTTEILTSNTTI